MTAGTSVAKSEEKEIMRPLKILVPLIKEDLKCGDEAAERAGMPYYKAAGEKMLEAKAQMSWSEMSGWVKRNFDRSLTTAKLYMSYAATNRLDSARGPNSLSEHSRAIGREPRGAERGGVREWRPDVDAIVDRARREMERYQEEELTKKQEREAEYQLALRLIDIGYKVLAKELHPDRGGSREAMQRLSRVRDHLKASL